MKAALLYGVNDLRLVEVERPRLGEADILIKVRACGVCPTDIRKYRSGYQGYHSNLKYPENVGHEWAGDVVEVGSHVQGFSKGMRVAGTARGGYAEYLKYDTGAGGRQVIVPIPAQVGYEQATFAEPLADCLHSLRDQGRVSAASVVAILGAGPMGLLHVMAAKALGAKVIASEPMAQRRSRASACGADIVLDPEHDDIVQRVRNATDGVGADAVIVSVGVPQLIMQALVMAARRGHVVLFAGFPRNVPVTLDPNLIHYGEVCVVGSSWVGVPSHESFGLYHEALSLIGQAQIPVGQLISARFPLDEIGQAFDSVEKRESLKVIILPHLEDLARAS